MDKNNKALFVLMQNVVDKLDAISKDVNNKEAVSLDHVLLKENNELKKFINIVIKNQSVLEQKTLSSKKEIIKYMHVNTKTPSVNNYNQYSLLGNVFRFKPWVVGAFIFTLVTAWSAIKYLPSYFKQNSLLSKEKAEYELFYNYVYLNELKNNKTNMASNILKKLQQKDSLFMQEYHSLLKAYKRDARKQSLKEELNSLDNHDR